MRSPVDTTKGRQTVVVAPTTTVILAPTFVWYYDVLTGEIINDDGAQTLNCYYEVSFTGAAPWQQLPTDQIAAIAPGETRSFSLPVGPYTFIRITGTMSGAGGNARFSHIVYPGLEH